uniref:Gamma-gliadin n=1 Tax=Triticum monococcum subsp. aegilopoides TaxID=52163 RepID=B6UKR0_TRIMO|nr:gamma-gliadin [Triticum monococcum subsp. aegilopoides]
MKTLFMLTILAMAATIATANMQVDPSGQVQWPQQQPFRQPQQPFYQQPQQTFPQPQQTFPHQPQQQFTQPQQPQQQFPQPQQPQQPFSQPQQAQLPFPQQPQQPFPQPQQPQQPFPQSQQPQQPFPQPQQPQQSFPQQQQPLIQPYLQQQMNPCKNYLLQQCNPVSLVSSLVSMILPRSDCQVMQQQCCQQLAQIPRQLQCAAIHSVVHSIIMQQEQQQGIQILRPLFQLVQGQGIIQPQQPAQYEVIRSLVLRTLPNMCNVYVRPDCSTINAPFASIVAGISGQ